MNSREIAAAIDEAESEAWTEALSSMRSQMDRLRATCGPIGESVRDAMRDVHRIGWYRGYKRGLERVQRET